MDRAGRDSRRKATGSSARRPAAGSARRAQSVEHGHADTAPDRTRRLHRRRRSQQRRRPPRRSPRQFIAARRSRPRMRGRPPTAERSSLRPASARRASWLHDRVWRNVLKKLDTEEASIDSGGSTPSIGIVCREQRILLFVDELIQADHHVW